MKTTAGPLTFGLTALAPISWGTTYVATTELLPPGRPLLVAATRVVPAGLVLVAAGRLRGRGRGRPRGRPQGREWLRTAALGACSFGVFLPLLVVAVLRLPGGVAAAVGGVQPLLVAGLGHTVAGRQPTRREVVLGVLAAGGVALVALRPGAGLDPVGLLAALGANASFALGVVLTRTGPAPREPLAATGWQMLLAGAVLAPLAVAVEGAPPVPTAANLAGAAHLSLVATAAAFVLWSDGVRRLPAPAPPLLGLAAPLTGAVLGWALLGQDLAPAQLLGLAVVVGAIAAGARPARAPGCRPRRAAPVQWAPSWSPGSSPSRATR